MFVPFVKEFFVRSTDAQFLRALKLEILTLLTTDTNVSLVLRELKTHLHSTDEPLVVATVAAVGRVAARLPDMADTCLRMLLGELHSRSLRVVGEAVVEIKKIIQANPDGRDDGAPLVLFFAAACMAAVMVVCCFFVAYRAFYVYSVHHDGANDRQYHGARRARQHPVAHGRVLGRALKLNMRCFSFPRSAFLVVNRIAACSYPAHIFSPCLLSFLLLSVHSACQRSHPMCCARPQRTTCRR
jgi:hypothetical protein